MGFSNFWKLIVDAFTQQLKQRNHHKYERKPIQNLKLFSFLKDKSFPYKSMNKISALELQT